MTETRYYYRVERVTHRPSAEDVLTVIKQFQEKDLQMARILATRVYLDELLGLEGKYSPGSFKSYDIKKGMGYNIQLLLIDTSNEEVYVVESTMEKMQTTVESQKEKEQEIYLNLGLDDSILKI